MRLTGSLRNRRQVTTRAGTLITPENYSANQVKKQLIFPYSRRLLPYFLSYN